MNTFPTQIFGHAGHDHSEEAIAGASESAAVSYAGFDLILLAIALVIVGGIVVLWILNDRRRKHAKAPAANPKSDSRTQPRP